MKNIKSHFTFLKAERSGILCIIFLIFMVQGIYFYTNPTQTPQLFADAEVAIYQQHIDSLKLLAIEERKPKIFPFNPNFISDYKGFTLGMSTKEIDRLHKFRATNKYVNSAKEFQTVTKVSDSLLSILQPHFKFPEWVTNKKKKKWAYGKKEEVILKKIDLNKATIEELRKVYGIGEKLSARIVNYRAKLGGFVTESQLENVYGLKPEVIQKVWKRFYLGKSNTYEKADEVALEKIDLNKATIEELRKVYGIGEKLSERIVKYRTKIGGFVIESQLEDVYGLKPEVVQNVWKRFYIEKPAIVKVNLNTCSLEELLKIPYIDYELADEIINQRILREGFKTFEDLAKIRNFPTKKIKIIELYLSIE
ncbi:helix-hairpin-helix domain-containing protein [Kordia sp. YSTF-M3]|uniref:Helix-hairpin-helix domain-containing protein n=1 Tax=Kordia aestuariivivens TaxID=2759037 RepID=A0ABR7Q5L6_9FLAO|nr:helix-hairpin-helix domain-containing protein [Kordia aestuariivivens]MBC8753649.1 helix-hairpin-helix domain-containing protein [Kordia aestuariivivens]